MAGLEAHMATAVDALIEVLDKVNESITFLSTAQITDKGNICRKIIFQINA